MCGIVGIVGVHSAQIERATNAIKHRGPDDVGFFRDTGIALGHRRLAIIEPTEKAHQPMISEDGRFTLIYNGEIYNHLEIRKELPNRPFGSLSDTETLLQALIEWGPAAVERLNGIFAFALYDRQRRELLLARDHFGVKPLYYSVFNDSFAFASELKSLALLRSSAIEFNYQSLFASLCFLWSPGAETPIRNAWKLRPGHLIRLAVEHPTRFQIKQYYEIPFTGQYLQDDRPSVIREFGELFQKAVQRQLLSDVPIGFFLSGGIDSSLVLSQADIDAPTCFTIKSPDGSAAEDFSSDLHFARLVSDSLGADLVEVGGDPNILAKFDEMIYYLDEPQADIAPLHIMNISDAARQRGIKVLLGGTGGDDILSGYRRHQFAVALPYLDLFPKWLARALSELAKSLDRNLKFRRFTRALDLINGERESRLLRSFFWGDPNLIYSLFSPDIRSTLDPSSPINFFLDLLKRVPNEKDPLNQMLFWELKTFLPDHNLNYTDKMGMARGVEIRVPFLDLDLVNFCARIPPKFKHRRLEMKAILRDYAKGRIPDAVIRRSKTGFGGPVRCWVHNELRSRIAERLSPRRIDSIGIFDSKAVSELLKLNDSRKIDGSYLILSLLAIDSWMTQFSGGSF